LISANHFSPEEHGIFSPIVDTLLAHNDHYLHLADLKSYLQADQNLVGLYGEPRVWASKGILNVASSGKFSSDRTIAQYATEIWKAQPCPVS
jgi:starch phosphorylase